MISAQIVISEVIKSYLLIFAMQPSTNSLIGKFAFAVRDFALFVKQQ